MKTKAWLLPKQRSYHSFHSIENNFNLFPGLLPRKWCKNFDKYHDQTKIKAAVNRNMLKTLHHKIRFKQCERHIQKHPNFLYKNILISVHKVRDAWTSVTQLKFHFFRHLQIITSEEHSVRRLNNESIWNKTFHCDWLIKTEIILKKKLETEGDD